MTSNAFAPQRQQHYCDQQSARYVQDGSPYGAYQTAHGTQNGNPRFSYTDAPTEQDLVLRRPTAQEEHGNAEVPPSSAYPEEKPPTDQTGSPYNFPPLQEPHPAQFALYTDPNSLVNSQRSAHAPQAAETLQNTSLGGYGQAPTGADRISQLPINSNGQRYMASEVLGGAPQGAWSPSPSKTPTYNPDSMAGPNGLTLANHQPGQSVHPNMDLNDGHWRHDLCGCEASVCALGLCCPCVLYGRTEYRLSQRASKKDPTDLLGYSACNGPCSLMALACGFEWVLTTIQRTRIRKLYSIQGSIGSDCVTSLCCCCCTLVQNEREVRDREELMRRHAGPAIGAGTATYVSPGRMIYAPPPA